MGARDVRAGGAYVEIGVRDNLRAGLNAAAKRLRSFAGVAAGIGAAVGGAGAAVLGPIAGATAKFLQHGDALEKMSLRTGASVEALSELTYAATQSGASAESVANGYRGMARVFQDATQGTKTAVDALGNLGLTVEDLSGLSQDARFTLLADRVSQIQDPSLKAAAAMDVFGRAGQDLLPMLNGGAEGINALRQRARDLGVVMSTEDATAAVVLGDLWGDLVTIVSRLGDVIGGALAPMLIPLADWFVNVAASAGQWLDANRPLIVTIAKVAAAVAGIGGVLTGIAAGALGLSFVVSGLSAAVGAVSAVFAGVGAVLGAIVSPIGLAVAAIAAGTVAFSDFTDAGQSLWQGLQETLGKAWSWVKQVFGVIYAAIAAGDFGLAAEIAWEAVKVAFAAGVDGVKGVFAGLIPWLTSTANELGGAIIGGFSVAWEWVKSTAASVGDWIAGAFSGDTVSGPLSGLLALFGDVWDGIAGGAAAIGDWIRAAWAGLVATAAATVQAVAGVWQGLPGVLSVVWDWIVTAASAAWQAIAGSAGQTPGVLASVWSTIQQTAAAVAGSVAAAWSATVQAVAGVWQGLPGVLSGVWDWIVSAAASVVPGILGLVQGLVSSLGTYFGAIGEAIGGVFGWIGEQFAALWSGAKETFGAIADALAGGDWAGAANIAWLSIQLAFQTGIAQVSRLWSEFTTGLMLGLDSAVTWMRDKFQAVVGWIAEKLVKLWSLFDKDVKVEAIVGTLEEDTQRKRDALKKDLESRNGQRAEALTRQLADTEAKLAELRTARSAAMEEATTAAEGKPGLLSASTDKLGQLLDKANDLAAGAMATATATPTGVTPDFEPGDVGAGLALAGGGSSGKSIGSFSVFDLGAIAGDDRVDVQQLAEQREQTANQKAMVRILAAISRNRAVYGR